MDAERQAKRARGSPDGLREVEAWVFDLDNTLYPASSRLFDQIDRRIRLFIARRLEIDEAAAHRLQKSYFHAYGTTLRGLMTHHGIAPAEFFAYVHDIDVTPVAPSAALGRALDGLPGRKLVFTNADAAYARRIMARLGVEDRFEAVFDIIAAGYEPKPQMAAYRRLIARHALEPERTAFIEDLPRNLGPAAELGMTTVWVRTGAWWGEREGGGEEHAHHVTDDLISWIEDTSKRLAGRQR